MRKTLIYIVSLFSISLGVMAQELFPVSQYMFNPLVFNPATTGKNEVFTFNLSHRSQWIGFEGAPSTQTLNVNWPLKKQKIALGVLVTNDEIGSRSNKSAFLNYAHRFFLGQGKLSLGLRGGFTSGNFKVIDVGEGEYIFDDKLKNYFLPNFGIGVYYYTPVYYAGLSLPLIFGYKMGNDNTLSTYHSASNYSYYLTGGYTYTFNSRWKIQPSLITRFEKTSFVPEINCNVIYKETFTGGLSYRSKEALVFIFAYNINYQTKFGISYDYGVGKLSNYHSGSFELNLQYLLGYKVKASNPGVF